MTDGSAGDRRGDTRGVSEVVGFVLVFSLVLGTISIVYVGGFSALSDTRDGERINNAERAFDVLADNFQQIGRGEAPRRATEIKVADAQMTLDDRYDVVVNVSGSPVVASIRPLTFHSGTGTKIVYEHGAIVRVDEDGGAVMLREPDFLFDDERTVIRHVELRGGQQSLGGTTTVLVRGERVTRQTEFPSQGQDDDVTGLTTNITLQTAPERTDVWVRYLEDREQLSDCTDRDVPGRDTHREIECDLTTDSLVVSRTRVDVELT